MIKKAYFRGLMKVAAQPMQQRPVPQTQSQRQDYRLVSGDAIPAAELQNHGFYKGTPYADRISKGFGATEYSPYQLRTMQAYESASKHVPSSYDPNQQKLYQYYNGIGRQNRDFYLKQGFRPPADYQYKTQFPFPNHPKKKQMMLQNQYQVNNNRGQQYNGYA